MPHRVVLDTDIGTDVDDALALALALAAPELALAAVTHVAGDTTQRARISRRLLDLAGQPDVPVYAGRREPLDAAGKFLWFGNEGSGVLDDGVPAPVPDDDAVTLLGRLFRQHDELHLIAIGPLTNVAAALAADPSLAGRIRQLTIMGGYLRGVTYGGASFPRAIDYNFCADARAAQQVLCAGIATRLVPTDVTMQVWMSAADLRALEASRSALHRALARAVRIWAPGMNDYLVGAGARPGIDNTALLHDPLAVACAYDESFCTFEDLLLEPRVEDGLLHLVEHAEEGPGIHPLRIATAVDRDRFLAHFRSRLGIG